MIVISIFLDILSILNNKVINKMTVSDCRVTDFDAEIDSVHISIKVQR